MYPACAALLAAVLSLGTPLLLLRLPTTTDDDDDDEFVWTSSYHQSMGERGLFPYYLPLERGRRTRGSDRTRAAARRAAPETGIILPSTADGYWGPAATPLAIMGGRGPFARRAVQGIRTGKPSNLVHRDAIPGLRSD